MGNTAKIDRLNNMCEILEEYRDAGLDELPDADIIRQAIEGCLNSRNGKLLRSAPKFRDKPLANILHRMVQWHRSGGWAGSLYMHKLDCQSAVTMLKLDLTNDVLYEQLQSLAITMLGGNSPAADRWQRVLGRK
tara:strand:- start:46 stop:447 length:402 start_codon:yes stop_codon:yes gene_type:complete